MISILAIMDLLGTIAFAASGALVGIRRNMDIFGVNVLAVVTATGGGILRDLLIGIHPPVMFTDPFYVCAAVITANLVFGFVFFHPRLPDRAAHIYDLVMFWLDTFGVAAFTVDGVMIGVDRGFRDNLFLIVFLGVITGVGGGMIRDVLANQMPDVLRKHVYAMASITGGVITGALVQNMRDARIGIVTGFAAIVLIRWLAAKNRWNLPKVEL